jgi:hypothetical protein
VPSHDDRASRSGRTTVLDTKLIDLLLEPSQTLAGVSPISVHPRPCARKYRFSDRPLIDGVA